MRSSILAIIVFAVLSQSTYARPVGEDLSGDLSSDATMFDGSPARTDLNRDDNNISHREEGNRSLEAYQIGNRVYEGGEEPDSPGGLSELGAGGALDAAVGAVQDVTGMAGL